MAPPPESSRRARRRRRNRIIIGTLAALGAIAGAILSLAVDADATRPSWLFVIGGLIVGALIGWSIRHRGRGRNYGPPEDSPVPESAVIGVSEPVTFEDHADSTQRRANLGELLTNTDVQLDPLVDPFPAGGPTSSDSTAAPSDTAPAAPPTPPATSAPAAPALEPLVPDEESPPRPEPEPDIAPEADEAREGAAVTATPGLDLDDEVEGDGAPRNPLISEDDLLLVGEPYDDVPSDLALLDVEPYEPPQVIVPTNTPAAELASVRASVSNDESPGHKPGETGVAGTEDAAPQLTWAPDAPDEALSTDNGATESPHVGDEHDPHAPDGPASTFAEAAANPPPGHATTVPGRIEDLEQELTFLRVEVTRYQDQLEQAQLDHARKMTELRMDNEVELDEIHRSYRDRLNDIEMSNRLLLTEQQTNSAHKLAELERAHQQELDDQQHRYDHAVAELRRRVDADVDAARDRTHAELGQEHDQVLAGLEERFERIEAEREQLTAERDELLRQLNDAQTALEDRRLGEQRQLHAARAELHQELARRGDLERELERTRQRLQNERSRSAEVVEDVLRTTAAAAQQAEQELAITESAERELMVNAHGEELGALRLTHQRELEDLRRAQHQELATMQQDMAVQVDRLRAEYERQASGFADGTNAQVEQLRAAHRNELAAARAEAAALAEVASQREQELEHTVRELRRRLSETR